MQTATDSQFGRLSIPFDLEDDEQLSELPRNRRWTRAEYYKLAEMGFFDERRVELIEGEIIEMAAMKSPHATAVTLARDVLQTVFIENFVVRAQLPLFADEFSEPEPDIAVVVGAPRDYKNEHPRAAVLIVEIADTTLYHDRNRKSKIYAQIGIDDYWILNLKRRQLEVYRHLKNGKYSEKLILTDNEIVSPLAKPDAKIAVSEFLP